MALSHSPSIVTDGLVLCLDAANPKSYPGSGTAWNDLSGNAYTGTLTGGPSFSSANGGSIVFDGVDDLVSTSTSYAFGTGQFTIGGWFKTNGSQPNASTIICVGTAQATTNWQISIDLSGSSQLLTFRGGTTQIFSTYNRDDNWTAFSIVRESTGINGLKIYINSNLNVSATITNNFSEVSLYKIARNRGNTTFYKGNVSSVSIYNRALSAAEVQRNFNALRGRYGI
jgi:hypothetical protein